MKWWLAAIVGLHFIVATGAVTSQCDQFFYPNGTSSATTNNKCPVQYVLKECDLPYGGVVITMLGVNTTQSDCEEQNKVTADIPIDKIAVKDLVATSNNISNNNRKIYLLTDDMELTDGFATFDNLSTTEMLCLLTRKSVALLQRSGLPLEGIATMANSVLKVEYLQPKEPDNLLLYNKEEEIHVISITPSLSVLAQVTKHFIIQTGWSRIVVLHEDSEAARDFSRKMKNLEDDDLQVFTLEYDGSDPEGVYHFVKGRNARVIIFKGSVHLYLQALDTVRRWYLIGPDVAYVYVSIENTFPFGYNIPGLVKCLQLNEQNVIYALNGTLSIVLSEGYGQQHDEYRSNMKYLITQEGYLVDNFTLFSLLTATYARESIAGIVTAIQHFISQNWPIDFMKSVLYNKQVKFTTSGLTGEVTFDKTMKEQNVTFTVYNIIQSIEETDNYCQPRAYIKHVNNSVTTHITMNYVSANGVTSDSPTIIYNDGTKNPPESQPEKLLPQSMIDPKYRPLAVIVHQAIVIPLILIYYFWIRHKEKKYAHLMASWLYRRGDIRFSDVPNEIRRLHQKWQFTNSLHRGHLPLEVGMFKKKLAFIRVVNFDNETISNDGRKQLQISSELSHPNVNHFIGCIMETTYTAVMTEYCSRRSLKMILSQHDIQLDCHFKFSFINDATNGLAYLHSKKIVHERLHLNNCLIDEYWALKLSDYGIRLLYNKEPELIQEESVHESTYKSQKGTIKLEPLSQEYLAPEVRYNENILTEECDIYSLGRVANAILTAKAMTKRATYLSKQDAAIIDRLNALAKQCLLHDAEDRPKAEFVKAQLAELNEEKKIDATSNVAGMWEAYTKIVEETLDDKIENLENLKLAVTRDIPKPLMKQISEGKEIPHKEYKNATILVVIIGDVEGMTLPHKVQRATHIVTTLQKILESVVVNNKVYKVEQTGTKCVFASGIHGMEVGDPIAEVADAAIHMGSICGKGSLTDDADVEPKLKMAIHNGPVICGVTEGKVPKHVIYGTTLDFAYTMAITAPNNTIYVSDYVARHLQSVNRFNLKDEQAIQFEDSVEMVHTLKEFCINEDFKVFNVLPSSRSSKRSASCSSRRRSTFSQQLMTMEEADIHNEASHVLL